MGHAASSCRVRRQGRGRITAWKELRAVFGTSPARLICPPTAAGAAAAAAATTTTAGTTWDAAAGAIGAFAQRAKAPPRERTDRKDPERMDVEIADVRG